MRPAARVEDRLGRFLRLLRGRVLIISGDAVEPGPVEHPPLGGFGFGGDLLGTLGMTGLGLPGFELRLLPREESLLVTGGVGEGVERLPEHHLVAAGVLEYEPLPAASGDRAC